MSDTPIYDALVEKYWPPYWVTLQTNKSVGFITYVTCGLCGGMVRRRS